MQNLKTILKFMNEGKSNAFNMHEKFKKDHAVECKFGCIFKLFLEHL